MGQAFSSEEVADALLRLKSQEIKAKSSGRPISSRKMYFQGILSNVRAGSSADEVDRDAIEAEGRAREAERAAAARQDRMLEGFSKHQVTVFVTRLFELDPDHRQAIFTAFESTEQGAKAAILLSKTGWSPKNAGALAMLRTWMVEARKEEYSALLSNPEDNNLEAWIAWRLDATLQGN